MGKEGIGHWASGISSPTVNCQLTTERKKEGGPAPSTAPTTGQLSTVNCQLSTVNCLTRCYPLQLFSLF
ncbi:MULTISPECIES: hypothetical protein [unclassified Microcoleus]|uniref:hypothetical protein n=1 Tax=unclassified Microcoleus TaxID=2642155 RepID=UPI0025CD8CE5|nr:MULTISPECIES: hypothetical protein [unclassified Microcoleus]